MTTEIKTKTWAFIPKNFYVTGADGVQHKVLYIDCSRGYDDGPAINPRFRNTIAVDCYYASHLASCEPMPLDQLEAIEGYADYHEENSVDLYNHVFRPQIEYGIAKTGNGKFEVQQNKTIEMSL